VFVAAELGALEADSGAIQDSFRGTYRSKGEES